MKEKLRTINILNHVFSIPESAVGKLNEMGAVYPYGAADHDLHVCIDELDTADVIALFDAVIAARVVSEGLKKYNEAKAAAEPVPAFAVLGSIQRLALQPGDTIVVTPHDDLSDTAATRLAQDVLAATGHQNKVLILPIGTTIGTMGVDMGKPMSGDAKAGAEIPLSPGDGAAKPKPAGDAPYMRGLETFEAAVAEFRVEAQAAANAAIRAMKKAYEAGVPAAITETIWITASGRAK